jgi:hypothetical protein
VRARLAATMLALVAAVPAAGCGSAAPVGGAATAGSPPGGPLATSLTTAAGTWAVAVMGGSAAEHNNFWQLFMRPAGASRWRLVTPPGVADNGGLVVAGAGGRSLISAIRPSQYLTYTPLAVTRDGGMAWAAAGPLDAVLASSPDALAAEPGTGRLLAVLTSGAAEVAAPGYTRWSTLVTRRALAVTPAGRRCGLDSLTAAAVTPSGEPLLAGNCSHPGSVGIFTTRGGTWQAAGPALAGTLDRQHVTVLRLTRAANTLAALLQAGTGPAASLLAAWSADNGSHWALSPPVRLGGAQVTSASFGPAGAAVITLPGNRAEAITGPAGSWRALPALPAGTAALAAGPGGGFDALAVHRTRLTVWQLAGGSATWHAAQVINVPIQFGSSG